MMNIALQKQQIFEKITISVVQCFTGLDRIFGKNLGTFWPKI